jgi:hypothetical protein
MFTLRKSYLYIKFFLDFDLYLAVKVPTTSSAFSGLYTSCIHPEADNEDKFQKIISAESRMKPPSHISMTVAKKAQNLLLSGYHIYALERYILILLAVEQLQISTLHYSVSD